MFGWFILLFYLILQLSAGLLCFYLYRLVQFSIVSSLRATLLHTHSHIHITLPTKTKPDRSECLLIIMGLD